MGSNKPQTDERKTIRWLKYKKTTSKQANKNKTNRKDKQWSTLHCIEH